MILPKILVLSCLLLLTHCAVGPHFTRPKAAIPITWLSKQPSTTTKASIKAFGQAQRFVVHQEIPRQWWTLFHSKPLNKLVSESLKHHPTVWAAKAALHAALENVYTQRAAFYPFVGLSFSPTKEQTALLLTSVLASNQYNYSLYTGQVFVSYTPDVFGGIRRQLESLVAQATIQQLQLQATYLSLSSNVVLAAIQEAAVREQIKVSKQLIDSQTKIVAITSKQIKLGDASEADLALQQAALAASQSTLPPLEKQLALQRDLLKALIGRFPNDETTPTFHLNSLQLPKDLPLSLPSTLLAHRPDIRAAEEQMRSANALIGVAIANRLPNVTIEATNAGTTATALSALFQPDTLFWSLAGIITHPLFDGRALLHKQRNAEALYKQAAAQYQATVINAFQNVADTLQSIRMDAMALRRASQAQQAAKKSLTISRRLFASGESSLLTVLLSEQAYQQATLNVIQAQASRLSDTVALFQALGGGWWNQACSPRVVSH